MRKLTLIIATFVFAVVFGWHGTVEADVDEIVVVVNKANPTKSMAREELRPIFQTTKTQWPDGSKAEPVNLAEVNALRQSFDSAVLGLDPDRVSRYWIDRKIRGGERPPRKVSNPSAVLYAVASDRGGIGYVSRADLNDTVRVIARIRNGQYLSP